TGRRRTDGRVARVGPTTPDAHPGVASGRLAVGSALMLPYLFAAERLLPSARERVRLHLLWLEWGRALTNTPRPSGPRNGVHFTSKLVDQARQQLGLVPHRPRPADRLCGTLSPGGPAGRSGGLMRLAPVRRRTPWPRSRRSRPRRASRNS